MRIGVVLYRSFMAVHAHIDAIRQFYFLVPYHHHHMIIKQTTAMIDKPSHPMVRAGLAVAKLRGELDSWLVMQYGSAVIVDIHKYIVHVYTHIKYSMYICFNLWVYPFCTWLHQLKSIRFIKILAQL